MAYRHRTLAFLAVLSVITFLDRVCISVAGPRMQAELGIAPEQWGLVIGAFTVGYGLLEIPGGMMADRWGARVTLVRIVIFWSLFTWLTGVVTTLPALLLVRFLFGAGEAGAYPTAASAISRWFPAPERSRAQGFVWMASRLGGMLSSLLVVPIQVAWGWRASFYLFAGAGVLWCVAWYGWYRDRPQDKRGVSAEELALILGGAAGGAPGPAGAAATGGAGQQHVPVVWRQVLVQGNFWKLLLMYFTYCWGGFFYQGWMHTYLQKGRGFSEADMKLWSALPFLLGALGTVTGGVLADLLARRYGLRFGRRVVGTAGLACGALCLAGTALSPDRIVAAVLLCLGFFAMDCSLPVSWALATDLGRRSAGSIAGAMNMAGQVGSFTSAAAFGYLVKWTGGDYGVALLPLAAMTGIAAILFTRIDADRPLTPG